MGEQREGEDAQSYAVRWSAWPSLDAELDTHTFKKRRWQPSLVASQAGRSQSKAMSKERCSWHDSQGAEQKGQNQTEKGTEARRFPRSRLHGQHPELCLPNPLNPSQ